MSELKATSSGEIRARMALLGYWWYEKSEADHYISELIADQQLELDDWYCKVQHHKYKRCLAMARWCHDKWIMSLGWDPADGHTADFFLHHKKWEKRWLALAEKFKEAKL